MIFIGETKQYTEYGDKNKDLEGIIGNSWVKIIPRQKIAIWLCRSTLKLVVHTYVGCAPENLEEIQ